jgi:hypothetical protein
MELSCSSAAVYMYDGSHIKIEKFSYLNYKLQVHEHRVGFNSLFRRDMKPSAAA